MARRRSTPLVLLLVVLLGLEAAMLAGATVFLLIELVVATPGSLASAVALVVLSALAALWLVLIAINALRGRAWTRGAALVWQVLQIAIAVGSFQGLAPRPDIGWLLLVPAVAVIVLLFVPSVVAATGRRGEDEGR